LWPRVLTSWARLVDGRTSDPRVGREVLAGVAGGVGIALAIAAHAWVTGRPDNVGYVENQLATLLGLRYQLGEMFTLWRSNIVVMMGFVVILVTARIVLRNAAAALVVAGLVFVPLAMPDSGHFVVDAAFAVAVVVGLTALMMRVGLLAATVCLVTHATLQSTPLGLGLGGWSTGRTAVAVAILAGAALYGFVRALGGRPVFRDVLGVSPSR
jgi:hypothetical protein